MSDFRLIPFDLSKAKTPENPSGLEVVTSDNRKVSIVDTHRRGQCPIIAYVENIKGDSVEDDVFSYNVNGKWIGPESNLDLSLKEPINKRRMTNQELSWWLRDCQEEHREIRYGNLQNALVYGSHDYIFSEENEDVGDFIEIRSNGGEWHEPLIEEE